MNIREMTEQWETEYLSPYASMSRNTRGRERQRSFAIYGRNTSGTGIGFSTARPSAD